MKRLIVLGALLVVGCGAIHEAIGVDGGRTLRAELTTTDGARIVLWRWSPTQSDAPKVLVLPEIGFDHRLVASLCLKLRDAGFDVATLDGREVTGATGRYDGYAGWTIDVARAVAAHGPRPLVVGIGLGGEAAVEVSRFDALRGLLLINVPLRHAVGDEALRVALQVDGYDPSAWLDHRIGVLLLGSGRSTSPSTIGQLKRLAGSPSKAMNAGIVRRLHDGLLAAFATIPTRALISVKDNVVASEDALPGGGGGFSHVRRLGLIEGFHSDYGHLDWLVDPAALAEVAPVIVSDLEGLP